MDDDRPIILRLIDICLWLIELPLPFAAAFAVYGAVPGSNWLQEIAQDATPYLIVILLIGALSVIFSALIGRRLGYIPILSIMILTGGLYPSMVNGKRLLMTYVTNLVQPVPTGEEKHGDHKLLYANALTGSVKAADIKSLVQSSSANVVAVAGVTEAWLHQASLETLLPQSIQYPRNDDFGLAIYSSCTLTELNKKEGVSQYPLTVHAKVECPSAKPYHVVVAQFYPPLTQPDFDYNREGFAKLSDFVNQIAEPVVVTGEFFSSSFSQVFRQFTRSAQLTDAIDTFGLIRSSRSSEPKHWLMVDHFLHRGDIDTASIRVDQSASVERPALLVNFSVKR